MDALATQRGQGLGWGVGWLLLLLACAPAARLAAPDGSQSSDGGYGPVGDSGVVPVPTPDTGAYDLSPSRDATSGTAGDTAADPCAGVECGELQCPPGQVPRIPEGACCPICGEAGNACLDAEAEQTEFVANWIEQQEALPCVIDIHCTAVDVVTACGNSCGAVVAAAFAGDLSQAAQLRAEELCAHCRASSTSCPGGSLNVACIDRLCVLGPN